jgi:Raf kinase inhibitor-like YbhB/YbcL family protein
MFIFRYSPHEIMKLRWFLCGLLLAGFVLMGGCTTTSPSLTATPVTPVSPSATGAGNDTFSLQVASISSGQALPATYTCTGAGESPEILWNGVPAGTQSLVLILDDPDAPRTFTHWLVYNIPPESRGLTRAQTAAKVLADGAQQGDSSAGSRGYYPPCPPAGRQHRYIFRLYALDTNISMPAADRAGIDAAMTGHVIGTAETVTTFRR